jgi:hypothetical protein
MLEGGYEIYMVEDASGGTSKAAHDYSMLRMIQAGIVPVTWQQVLLEWQRDWANRATYDAVMNIVREHSGAYGMGVDYAYTMLHGAPERVTHGPRLDAVPASIVRSSAPVRREPDGFDGAVVAGGAAGGILAAAGTEDARRTPV